MRKTVDDFFDDIDAARSLRVRELSEIKRHFGGSSAASDPMGVQSKALVVLSYAAWEAFYNECVDAYCEFLQNQGKRISDASWKMLVGALVAEFDSLRDRNHSNVARRHFVEKLQERLVCDFTMFDRTTVKARSNLDWDKLDQNFQLLDFDPTPFQQYRNRLDKEVVGWRHTVAHGDAPNLGRLDAADHISLVARLMMLASDTFQTAMLDHI